MHTLFWRINAFWFLLYSLSPFFRTFQQWKQEVECAYGER